MDSWTCLGVQKGPGVVADEVIASLKLFACELYRAKHDSIRVSTDACDGVLKTAWETHTVGSRIGILFRAQIDQEDGEYFVNFLLNIKDLERGAEFIEEIQGGEYSYARDDGKVPIEELSQFYDLRKTKKHLH